jgi:putative membrane protein
MVDMTAQGDREPDQRFTLANERTFLAWIRTALSLLAAGVAVVQLVPDFAVPGARKVLGVFLAALAMLTAATGVLRWDRVECAMRRSMPLPRTRVPWIIAAVLVIIATASLVLLAIPDR